MASPLSPSEEIDDSGDDQSGSMDDDDFVCVPTSNLNKDKVTFNTRDQLLKKSLMMSEVSNVAGGNNNVNAHKDIKAAETRSMILSSQQKLEKGKDVAVNSIHGSMQIKLNKQLQQQSASEDEGESESQISMDFPNQQEDKSLVATNANAAGLKDMAGLSISEVSQTIIQNQKEMQTLKYISEGGIVIKRNLFDTWLHVYDKEIQYLDPKESIGVNGNPPPQPIQKNASGEDEAGHQYQQGNLFNLKFDRKQDSLVFS